MTLMEKEILDNFKSLLTKRLNSVKLILFGSRARGNAEPLFSDMDVLVVINNDSSEKDFDYVSDCAWEAGFSHGIVIVPVVFTKNEWENSPEKYSLLARAVETEGVTI